MTVFSISLSEKGLEDNGKPIEMVSQCLIEKAKSIAASAYDLDISGIKPSLVLSKHRIRLS